MAGRPELDGADVPARAARAGVFAVASGCLATAAHTAGDGDRPPAPVLLVAVALIARVAYGLAGRERGAAAIAAGVGACQLALHLAIVVATVAPAPAGHPNGHAGHAGHSGHAGMHDLLAAAVPSAPMLLAHMLAAGCTALALRQAERTLWATRALRERLSDAAEATVVAARAMAARLRGLLGVAPAAAPARQPRHAGSAWAEPDAATRTCSRLSRASRRRGPPVPIGTGM